MMPDILIVEDNQDLREEVAAFLRFHQFDVHECDRLETARAQVNRHPPAAAIIDVMLPDGSGLSLLDTLRDKAPDCVRLVLSARGDIDLKLDAYRKGADGYLMKPIDLRELAALVNAALKRGEGQTAHAEYWTVEGDALSIEGPHGDRVTLSMHEAAILKTLARSEDRFASRRTLIAALGFDYLEYDEQRLEAMISRLRKKLSPLGSNPIKAAHGKGYVFTQRLILR